MIGQNGKGKTSLLDALSVAVGSWLLGLPDQTAPGIAEAAIRLEVQEFADTARIEKQLPVVIAAEGVLQGQTLAWSRELAGKSTSADKVESIMQLAKATWRGGSAMTSLPLVAYYGTGRLWVLPEERALPKKTKNSRATRIAQERHWAANPGSRILDEAIDLADAFASRLAGYQNSIAPACDPAGLLDWLKFEQQLAYDEQRESTQFMVVKAAIQQAVAGCTRVDYQNRLGLLLTIEGQPRLPFNALSDGQRNMVAMIGDMAYRAAQLNPHLGQEVLRQTSGVVLIDELDLHLHPRWQRHVVEDLRRIFPQIQFIATTHSPFIVQTAREGEIIKLDGDWPGDVAAMGLEDVVARIMDVDQLEHSPRYKEKLALAREYLDLVEESRTASPERRAVIRRELTTKLQPYSDNPAYTALLERKGLAVAEP